MSPYTAASRASIAHRASGRESPASFGPLLQATLLQREGRLGLRLPPKAPHTCDGPQD